MPFDHLLRSFLGRELFLVFGIGGRVYVEHSTPFRIANSDSRSLFWVDVELRRPSFSLDRPRVDESQFAPSDHSLWLTPFQFNQASCHNTDRQIRSLLARRRRMLFPLSHKLFGRSSFFVMRGNFHRRIDLSQSTWAVGFLLCHFGFRRSQFSSLRWVFDYFPNSEFQTRVEGPPHLEFTIRRFDFHFP